MTGTNPQFSLISVVFSCLLIAGCANLGGETNVLELDEPIPVQTEEPIMPDTSLFAVNIKTWNEAPYGDRLANCAGMTVMSFGDAIPTDAESFNALARELFECIDETSYGMPTMNDNAVKQLAYRCLDAMGYHGRADSLRVN